MAILMPHTAPQSSVRCRRAIQELFVMRLQVILFPARITRLVGAAGWGWPVPVGQMIIAAEAGQ